MPPAKEEKTLEQEFDAELGRDPIPQWDGYNPEARWLDKKREIEPWHEDTKKPLNKQGIHWYRRTPLDCLARAILNNFSNEDLRRETAFDDIMRAFDQAYKGYLRKLPTDSFLKAVRATERTKGENFISYISRYDNDMNKYEKSDVVRIPGKMDMRFLLVFANLDFNQKNNMQL